MPLKLVADSRSGARQSYGASLILVRPDQFVAWTSDEERRIDATKVLRRAIGRE
jgi:hypothetical protein